MKIRALLFDADEVFQYPDPNRNAELGRILGFVPEPLAEFVAEVHAAEDRTLTGALNLLDVLLPMLSRWGAPDKAHDIREWLNAIAVDHAVLDLVSELRLSGYRCALATNQQPHRANFMAHDLRYRDLFDRCFFSCHLGLAKPDPRYFQAILTELQLAAQEVIFIDDKPDNVRSASSLGIHTICFANPKDGGAQSALRELLARFGVLGDARRVGSSGQ
jgi:putative hydrolase of the HAD superfamily